MLLDYSSFRQHMIMLHLDGIKENWHKGMYKQYAAAIEPPMKWHKKRELSA
jgi:hypothetical protein